MCIGRLFLGTYYCIRPSTVKGTFTSVAVVRNVVQVATRLEIPSMMIIDGNELLIAANEQPIDTVQYTWPSLS